ncbi:MAG TPA: RHS repeat-associated core domain-containing protein [Anaerolineae bacterium]|nr:RHS repeat-associated core domain-containing protein [Anaerolineae bacterium]
MTCTFTPHPLVAGQTARPPPSPTCTPTTAFADESLGSASLSTNASGGKVSDMRYYPYGETRSGTIATDRRYTGQRQEIGLGLYDYNARYYDPALSRFIQADTIVPSPANPQSLNRYAYVLNNPLRYTDPSGYFSEEQLNWLGYFKDSTSEDIWAFLLTLQPGDFIGGATQNDLWTLVIGQRAYNENAAFGLWLGRGDESVELAEWLSNQANLNDVWAHRELTPIC